MIALIAAGQALYLFLPLLVSAAAMGIAMRLDLLRGLARPIDGGRRWRGKRVLGDGKTWRGVVVAVIGCVLTAAAQRNVIGPRAGAFAVFDYATVDPIGFGVAMGAGAMLGELPNSFVKRRLGIARGGTARGPLRVLFYVWDQIDLLTVAWPAISPWVRPTPRLVAASVAVALVVHPIVALVGYLVGARTSAR